MSSEVCIKVEFCYAVDFPKKFCCYCYRYFYCFIFIYLDGKDDLLYFYLRNVTNQQSEFQMFFVDFFVMYCLTNSEEKKTLHCFTVMFD